MGEREKATRFFLIGEIMPKEATVHWTKVWDKRILITADRLRERYGPMLCNTYVFGGNHQFRGWRPWKCSVGATYSQHKFGRAIDLEPVQVTVNEIHADMRRRGREIPAFEYVGRVEDAPGMTWLHVDICMITFPIISMTPLDSDIYFFKP